MIIFLIIAVVAFYFYFSNKLPPGVEVKGKETSLAFISLLTGIVSLAGTVLTFIMKIIELKGKSKEMPYE